MPTRRGLVLTLLAAVVVVISVVVLVDQGVGPLPNPEGCSATVGGVVVDLSTEQARNATVISAVSVRRGLPARAASIALAAAFQESKLVNLDHGDRDSLGLFQQRPSQGWGTARQILDPYHAVNAFYDALVKISGYEQLRITDAAQQVQRSGYPEAYAAHESDARALASALTGYSPAKFSCVVDAQQGLATQQPGAGGLTPRAQRVRRDLVLAFGPMTVQRVAGSGAGSAFDVPLRPVGADQQRRGWALASYLVAQAVRLHVDHVVVGGRVWTAGTQSSAGWRSYHRGDVPGYATARSDRVHVDVRPGS